MIDPERASMAWRKSTFSGGGDCVEVATAAKSVALRDSHAPAGPLLTFTSAEWVSFLDDVRRGAVDSPGGPSVLN